MPFGMLSCPWLRLTDAQDKYLEGGQRSFCTHVNSVVLSYLEHNTRHTGQCTDQKCSYNGFSLIVQVWPCVWSKLCLFVKSWDLFPAPTGLSPPKLWVNLLLWLLLLLWVYICVEPLNTTSFNVCVCLYVCVYLSVSVQTWVGRYLWKPKEGIGLRME